MGAVELDFTMKNDYAHPTSQKRGDIAVSSDGHLQPTNAVDWHQSPGFIIDVKVCAMVTGDGDWKALWNADKTVLENHTLTQAEDEKFSKHKNRYAAVGYTFFPFVLGCFGCIGSQAARFLCALAFLELQQHDAIRERAGLGGRLQLRSRNSGRTHVLHAFVHLQKFCGIFTKQCDFIILMTIASAFWTQHSYSKSTFATEIIKNSNLVKVFSI